MVGRYRTRFVGDSSPKKVGDQIVTRISTGEHVYKQSEYRQVRGQEWMIDATHSHWRSAARNGNPDVGGPMHHFKCKVDWSPASIDHWDTPGFDVKYRYVGELYPFVPTFNFGDDHGIENSVPETTLVANGTIGFARYKPNAPQAGLGQFIGELRDLPRLPALFTRQRERALEFSGMGSEYLNIEFGWKPFLRDVFRTARNALNSERIIRQLVRDNGRTVRRKGTISVTEETGRDDHGYNLWAWPPIPVFLYQGHQHRYVDYTFGRRYDFAGAFRYWIPTTHGFSGPESDRQRRRLARIVYGVELNPRLLYQLMPWSWMIDWGSSLGAVVSNYADNEADSLVATYAYCTGRKYALDKWTVDGRLSNKVSFTTSATFNRKMVRRLGATPYGFGLTIPDLSGSRLAILAALGLSRLS